MFFVYSCDSPAICWLYQYLVLHEMYSWESYIELCQHSLRLFSATNGIQHVVGINILSQYILRTNIIVQVLAANQITFLFFIIIRKWRIRVTKHKEKAKTINYGYELQQTELL